LARREYGPSIDDSEAVLRATPDNAMAERLRAQALLDSGRAQEAIGSAKRLLRLAPKSAEGHAILGNALKSVGRDREAAAEFELYRSLRNER
jgi:predicted Zn-dependent protease